MAYTDQISVPASEPVTLTMVKQRLRLPSSYPNDDTVLSGLIVGVRQDCERLMDLMLARRKFAQVLDSFPYYIDVIQSQNAYPPAYYSAPRYATTLWNYSQMIKLARAPLISVDAFTYIGSDGLPHTLQAGVDFIVDPETKLARIFPMVGRYWPPCLYTPNAVKIEYTAGFGSDPTEVTDFTLPSPPPSPPNQQASYKIVTGIPQAMIDFMTSLVVFRYLNPGTPGMPLEWENRLMGLGLFDFAPTRG